MPYQPPNADILKTLETAPNMYLVLSPGLYILTASDLYLEATQSRREVIAGKHIFEAFPDNPELPDADGVQNINASLQEVLRTKKPHYMRIQRYDVPDMEHPGKFIQRYWDPMHHPVLTPDGDIHYIIQLATNVTERVLAEEAFAKQIIAHQKLEVSEKYFRHLADIVPAKISNALPSGEVTFFNQRWLDYAGMNFEDLRDFGYHQMMHPDEIPVFQEKLAEAAAKGVALESEMRFKDINGKYRWHLNIASPILNDDGEIIMWVGSTTDIQRIKEEDQRKSDFIGMVSHELKTPLTFLTAIVQVANKKLEKSEDSFLAGAMEKAGVQVKRMSNMINGFLNVSRLEFSKLIIDKHEFNLENLIEETIKETELTIASHIFKFEPCNPVMVRADYDKIGSVITNLISNAVKYSPKGKMIDIKCEIIGNCAQVSVRDEGMGLKPQDIEKVFERYYRVETHHTQHISSFGIGLYLSAEIIHRHNGKIWVESESGVGSTFYFSLPLN
ncbi:PAS domain-containing sensor histidine kinase [Mucilaginibacter aquaedulcis]|uniref:PAS domain-containing sensor histidine kinase n=1 Tax=Mucilaginibacter aquaedulcis TaxID=1187081 RepID=UPI0025B3CF18|nr:ATP-binding protein [Mucilaginibacter aquaedulcis]MDN3547840.1 ATP-binding protein [Mucilaginibacter aquaedulcis]